MAQGAGREKQDWDSNCPTPASTRRYQESCQDLANISWQDKHSEEHAAGDYGQGECAQVIIKRFRAKGDHAGWQKHFGSFDPQCGCSWCIDRAQQYDLRVQAPFRMKDAPSGAGRLPQDAPPRKERLQTSEQDAPSGIGRLQQDAPSRKTRLHADDDDAAGRVLKKGMSVAVTHVATTPTTSSSRQAEQWTTQRFIVSKAMISDILMRLHAPNPTVDAFADEQSSKCVRFWGPGGEAESGWSKSWSYDRVGVIWANPAFSDLVDVVKKIKQDKAQVILVAPDWKDYDYYDDLWPMVQAYHYYPREADIFECSKQQMSHRRQQWGVWALYLNGAQDKREETNAVEVRRTSSSRRRWRRRQQSKE